MPHVQAGAWDHPRRCGENNKRTRSSDSSAGSPPQVRGKPKGLTYSMQASVGGSPPQVRGKLYLQAPLSGFAGITPAGAGKTNQQFRQRNRTEDHPRRCGENLPLLTAARYFLGSPPQVRGKHISKSPFFPSSRITPAGAGKTSPYPTGFRLFWDHPRRCGENASRRTGKR